MLIFEDSGDPDFKVGRKPFSHDREVSMATLSVRPTLHAAGN